MVISCIAEYNQLKIWKVYSEHTATQVTGLAYKTLPQNSLMTSPFKGSMQIEPKPELGIYIVTGNGDIPVR